MMVVRQTADGLAPPLWGRHDADMAGKETEREVYDPEVLPPEAEPSTTGRRSVAAVVRWRRLWQALLSGLILDGADLFTRMPLIPHGAVLGALTGWYVVRTQAVPRSQRIWWIATCAVYCAMPLTEFYPLATLYLIYRALTLKPTDT